MNRTKLKNYAPQARKDFIQAVTAKAAQYGLTTAKIEPMTEKGDVVLIAGKPFPKSVGDKRKRLEDRIKKHGFEQTMEAMAYTWFNRLVAIRYMELHGYLEHGFRVLSSKQYADGSGQQTNDNSADRPLLSANWTPEILEKAQYVDLPGLEQKKVIELKLDGTKEEELYRLLLTAQFNALSKAMPFLFEKIDDETELLLPDSLLNSDSLIRKLVTEIDEEDWKEVEIIGWLYQFYISDKKDEVIGKVVKSEDIPAATQLFTPNWIVKYLVQNTIGRQWLATYPQSSLRSTMEYYIEPAEQTPEVQEQLKAITPTSLNPEELTLLDPACGSGHILVEAYDLFKAIYEERGYRSKDIPALILQKNLYGLEIDDRAAQLAAFALMMKARADYPRIFDANAKPNVVSFVESKGLDAEEVHYALMSPLPSEKQTAEPPRPDGFLFETENNLFTHAAEVKAAQTTASSTLPDITKEDIAALIALFESAKTFGSLIQLPTNLSAKLTEIEKRLVEVLAHGDLTHSAARVIEPLLHQAVLIAGRYDAVVANPPYMGMSYFTPKLKQFISEKFEYGKSDLYSAFMLRNAQFACNGGLVGMITIPNWMSISRFEEFRRHVFNESTFESLLHNGRGVWGSDFGSCSFVQRRIRLPEFKAAYRRLFDTNGSVASSDELRQRFFEVKTYYSSSHQFERIPGSPLLYWASERVKSLFANEVSLGSFIESREGLATADNDRFLRQWYEVAEDRIGFSVRNNDESVASRCKWFPYVKGGDFRKWYGNVSTVVNWWNDGADVKANIDLSTGRVRSHNYNGDYGFRPGFTWSGVSISALSVRQVEFGFMFDATGPMAYASSERIAKYAIAVLNSRYGHHIVSLLAPTVHFKLGHVMSVPCSKDELLIDKASEIAAACIELAKQDWNSVETAWDFEAIPQIQHKGNKLICCQEDADRLYLSRFAKMKQLEEANNKLFIESFGLESELASEVADEHISLYRPDRTEDIKRLLAYAIGSVMGRYSLDKPGLIYAHSGNEGFDPSQYKKFRADDDGIIPLLDSDWGIRDDAANRIFEFISVAWPKEHLDENLKFIADSLTPANGEQPKDTIRRYLATGFYKHHLSMYKKRPIYWLFSSGKQRAFQCLVYLHRYNEGTLARMRTEYVIPLMGKMTARLEHLQGPPEQKGTGGEIAATSAVTVKRKLEKERDSIKKQLAELQAFDEKLRHYADLRIKLDLDDGVKVNYGKFSDPEIGDILAEVKSICGTKDED
jgi:type II restriction/modification system DNA methylase subunit YeeA